MTRAKGFGVMFLSTAICVLLAAVLLLYGCSTDRPADGDGEDGEDGLGRYMFDEPAPITYVGRLDTPRLARDPGNGTVHLAYLLHDDPAQRIMYTRLEDGEFGQPALLSQADEQKRGGGYIASPSENLLIGYWVNIAATGGQLLYKMSENGGRTFTLEARWNERNEARWPCVLEIGDELVAYFFLHYRDDWELVGNREFSDENEPTILQAQGTPFHLQGFTDGSRKVWLAYFVRRDQSGGGRIAFLTSSDGGYSFSKVYLMNDMIIENLSGFFNIDQSLQGRKRIMHLIFTEETPEFTTVYYTRSETVGESFDTPVAMFRSEYPLTRVPLMAVYREYVFIATADADVDGPAIRYIFSEDSGETFSEPAIAVRNISSPETLAGLIGPGGSVLMVWDDLAAGPEEGEQLYRMNGSLRGQ